MPERLLLDSKSKSETAKIGNNLGKLMSGGDVIILSGELGAGKTTIAKAISKGLGLQNVNQVISPSYAIINEYIAGIKIYHFDLYRISSQDELYEIGAFEYFQSDGVCIVEWGEKFIDSMPKERLEILLEHAGKNERKITLTPVGVKYKKKLAKLKSSLI